MVNITLYSKKNRKGLRDKCSFCGADLFEGEECIVEQDSFDIYCLECGLRAAVGRRVRTLERIESCEKHIKYYQDEIKRFTKVVLKNHECIIAKIQQLINDKNECTN